MPPVADTTKCEVCGRESRPEVGPTYCRAGFELSGYDDEAECKARGYSRLSAEVEALRGRLASVIHTIGGEVEGHATSEGNYLQRLRALVAAEAQVEALRRERDAAKASCELHAKSVREAREQMRESRADAERLRAALEGLLDDHGELPFGTPAQRAAVAAAISGSPPGGALRAGVLEEAARECEIVADEYNAHLAGYGPMPADCATRIRALAQSPAPTKEEACSGSVSLSVSLSASGVATPFFVSSAGPSDEEEGNDGEAAEVARGGAAREEGDAAGGASGGAGGHPKGEEVGIAQSPAPQPHPAPLLSEKGGEVGCPVCLRPRCEVFRFARTDEMPTYSERIAHWKLGYERLDSAPTKAAMRREARTLLATFDAESQAKLKHAYPALFDPSAPPSGEPRAAPTECPSEKCPMCNGSGCAKCGAGFTQSGAADGARCEHDAVERHEEGAPVTGASSPKEDERG